MTFIWLKFCFQEKDTHLSGENNPGGEGGMHGPMCVSLHKHSRIPPIQCMHVKAAIWEASKVAKNTPKLVTYTKIQSEQFPNDFDAPGDMLRCLHNVKMWRYLQRPLAVWGPCEKQGKPSTAHSLNCKISAKGQRKPNYNELKWGKMNFGKV